MSKSRRKPVQKYYDRVAPVYDQSYEDEFWQWHDALTWDYLKPFLPTNMSRKVVDLGCGTGKWSAKLVKSGFDVTCVDISHRMLDQARVKIAPQSGRAAFLQADLCDLSALPAGGFGCAIALGDPIGCADSPPKALKEIRRILAEDGVLVATFDNRLAAVDYHLSLGDPRQFASFLRDGRTHWFTKDAAERFPIFTYAPRDIRELVQSAGLVVADMVGKTVLPMRQHRHLLATAAERREWARLEKSLCRDPAAMGRASHLQIACRVKG